MTDETSIIATLARRGASRMKESDKEPVDVERALFLQLAECRRECDQHKSAALASADAYNRACDEHRREMEAMRSQVESANNDRVQWKAKYDAIEARPPAVRYETNAADESIRAENSSLQTRCARAEALCEEMGRTIARLDAQVAQMSEPSDDGEVETEGTEAESSPVSYDIDVVRGGDNLVRSLRVRVAES